MAKVSQSLDMGNASHNQSLVEHEDEKSVAFSQDVYSFFQARFVRSTVKNSPGRFGQKRTEESTQLLNSQRN